MSSTRGRAWARMLIVCGLVVVVDHVYHENLTPESVARILAPLAGDEA